MLSRIGLVVCLAGSIVWGANVRSSVVSRIVFPGDLCGVAPSETSFLTTDPQVWFSYIVDQTAAGDSAQFEWVSPTGRIAAPGPALPVGGTGCFRYVMTIAGGAGAAEPGMWRARLRYNDQEVVNTAFSIADPPAAPISVVTSSALPSVVLGRPVTYNFAAARGSLPYSWSVSLGSLPPGLVLAPAGIISGTPTSVGAFQFRLRVTGAGGGFAEQTFGVAVIAPMLTPQPASVALFGDAAVAVKPSTTIALTSNGAPLAFTVSAETKRGGNWLSVTANQNTTPATLSIATNLTGLQPGEYLATVTVKAANASPPQIAIPVGVILIAGTGTGAIPSIITTYAGTDWVFPQSGQALEAPVFQFAKIEGDPNGNIIAADALNHVVVRISPDGTYKVIAGNGIPGFSGDGGPATSASLHFPRSTALDQQGNLFIADSANHVIRRVTPDGIITTVAGTRRLGFNGDGPALATQLNNPQGVSVGVNGGIWIVDNFRIRLLRTDGELVTAAGNGTQGSTGDGGPARQAQVDPKGPTMPVDSAGNLYFAENGNRIRRIATDGTIATIAGTGVSGLTADGQPAAGSPVGSPNGMAFDKAGNLAFSEFGFNRIRFITPEGLLGTLAGRGAFANDGDGGPAKTAGLQRPITVGFDSNGNAYIQELDGSRVRKVDSTGIITLFAGNNQFYLAPDGAPALSAYFRGPRGLAIDPAGNLMVVDDSGNFVFRINSDGSFERYAGSGANGCCRDNVPLTQALFTNPSDAIFDQQGNLYLSDTLSHRIVRITPNGTQATFAGSPGAGFADGAGRDAKFSSPRGLGIDGNGNLYVADEGNNRIRRITPAGVVSTVAGTGVAGATDGPAATATFNRPRGVTAGPGALFVADTNNHKIRRIAADGTVATFAGTGENGSTGDGNPARQAKISAPVSPKMDAQGNLFFIESNGDRIRRVGTGGNIFTFAGTGKTATTGDGGPAGLASLNGAAGLAIDGKGNVFVSEFSGHRVRVILGTAPTYTAAPSSLGFTALADGAPPPPQTISITSPVFGIPFGVQARTDDGGGWLRVDATTGTMPATIRVTVDPSGLTRPSYTGMVTVISTSATPATQNIRVTLTIQPNAAPVLGAEPGSLTFSFGAGQGGSSTQTIRVLNTGSGSLDFTASASTVNGGSWLSATPISGQTSGASPASVGVAANAAGLGIGSYSGSVTILSQTTGRSIAVPVAMTISDERPRLVLSQSGTTFTAVAGGGVTPAQTIRVINSGLGSLAWTSSIRTLSGGEWLKVAQGSGSSAAGGGSSLTVSVNTAGVAPGEYYGIVRVTAEGAIDAPGDIQIVLNVLPSDSNPGAFVQPAGVVFVSRKGADPGSQGIQVTNLTTSSQQFYAGVIPGDAGFSVQPASGRIAAGATATINVQSSNEGIETGLYNGTVTIQLGAQARTAQVVSAVLPAGSADALKERTAGGCEPNTLIPVFTTVPQQFSTPAQWPVPIVVRVIDNCGSPLTSGRVYVRFSNGDTPLTLLNQLNGDWSVTWFGANPRTTQMVMTAVADRDNPQLHGEYALVGNLQANGSKPLITPGGVVNLASMASGTPLARGSMVSISGSNLSSGENASGGQLSPTLGGTEVLLAGRSLPLSYASGGQVIALLPPDLPAAGNFMLAVIRGEAISPPERVVLAPYQPAIFTTNAEQQGNIIRRRGDELVLADAANPASAGDTIVIYCTGLGATDPVVPADQLPVDDSAKVKGEVTVRIGGVAATVTSASLTPGAAGVYQVIATVPGGVAAGDGVSVVLGVADQVSAAVRMGVR